MDFHQVLMNILRASSSLASSSNLKNPFILVKAYIICNRKWSVSTLMWLIAQTCDRSVIDFFLSKLFSSLPKLQFLDELIEICFLHFNHLHIRPLEHEHPMVRLVKFVHTILHVNRYRENLKRGEGSFASQCAIKYSEIWIQDWNLNEFWILRDVSSEMGKKPRD